MKRSEVMELFRSLSVSTGSYGRFYYQILEAKKNNKDAYNEFMKYATKFHDGVSLIMDMEG